MLLSAGPGSYEPSYVVENELELELIDTTESPNQTGKLQSGTTIRIGPTEFNVALRRGFTSRDYDFIVQCTSNTADPHWSLKLDVAYKINLRAIGREIEDSKHFDANDEDRFFTIGPFEADVESSTDARVRATIKLIDWKAIHPDMQYDFTRRTTLNDCTLIIEGKRIFVTKSILAMQCGHFRKLFDEENHAEFKILNALYDDMVIFLTLIYPHTTSDQHSTLLKNTAQMDRLLQLANRFDCPSVTSLIEEDIIKTSCKNNANFLLADKHCLSKLCSQWISKLQTRSNYKSLQRSAEYSNLSEELRSYLLESVVDKMSSRPVPRARRRHLSPSPNRGHASSSHDIAQPGTSTCRHVAFSNHQQRAHWIQHQMASRHNLLPPAPPPPPTRPTFVPHPLPNLSSIRPLPPLPLSPTLHSVGGPSTSNAPAVPVLHLPHAPLVLYPSRAGPSTSRADNNSPTRSPMRSDAATDGSANKRIKKEDLSD